MVLTTVDQIIESYIQPTHPGAAIAIVQEGVVVHRQGYGFANLEWQIPIQPNTVFKLASLTKPFTALGILLLQEEGKLSIEDPLQQYYRYLPLHGNDVRLHHLLSHTSGLKDIDDLGDWFPDKAWADRTPDELVKAARHLPYAFAAGTAFRYSNLGYILLGLVIEKVSGLPYETFMRTRIFDPAGMDSACYMHNHTIIPHRATGYAPDTDGFRHPPSYSMEQPFAAGGLGASLDDLIRFDQALSDDRLVSPKTRAQMQTGFELKDGRTGPYGFGWLIGRYHGHSVVYHGGMIEGFAAILVRFPDAALSVICLLNRQGVDILSLAAEISRQALPIDSRRYHPALLTEAIRRQVSGRYLMMGFDGMELEIVPAAGRLELRLPDGTFDLYPLSADQFFYRLD